MKVIKKTLLFFCKALLALLSLLLLGVLMLILYLYLIVGTSSDPDFNKKLRKSGLSKTHSVPLTELLPDDVTRVCLFVPSYAYDTLEEVEGKYGVYVENNDYFTEKLGILGASITTAPGLLDSNSPFEHLMMVTKNKEFHEMRLFFTWETSSMNWCASPSQVLVTVGKNRRKIFNIQKPEYFPVP